MRVGEADGDPEGDGRRTLANGWESRLWRLEDKAFERGGVPSGSLGGHVHLGSAIEEEDDSMEGVSTSLDFSAKNIFVELL